MLQVKNHQLYGHSILLFLHALKIQSTRFFPATEIPQATNYFHFYVDQYLDDPNHSFYIGCSRSTLSY